MFKPRTLAVAVTCLALTLGSVAAVADPGNGKGQGSAKGNAQGGQGHGSQDHKGKGADADDRGHGPSIDRGGILGVLGGYRDYWSPGPSLPPGIQKKLARGKPLPPGIAKKLDGRLLGRLPHYDGYEWQQAGTDLILVAIASGLIYEVLEGAFD
ncbi:anti-virulence regulator CigR family protein [Pseudomonas allii]|uniref:Anti-virulence regulator CigR family protein n=2 Tax=Pseudomonas allii TaxID=2740531 RepID=A0ACC6LAV5_9PSED|nr:anti-virulence regulator CigR family protein [Pseudomonas allii]KTB60936.1 hypothetical protein AO066_03490 [Pseudomonas fluorescens]MDR9875549.1 anti-virulence regulator CigR family protein [Pseudomonas allii]NWN46801.1 hypothetical protein [Pseudomonas allii]NWN59794.1 hypothetical protein [Pseudomonas allii]RMP80821.1 hypothetical protein ALQ17_02200 [Pseudomonas fluorescens]